MKQKKGAAARNNIPEAETQKQTKRACRRKQRKGRKILQAMVGGICLMIGCGCFLYPNYREWKTDQEVETIIQKFDQAYKEGLSEENTKKETEKQTSVLLDAETDKDASQTEPDTAQPEIFQPTVYPELYQKMQQYNKDLYQNGQSITDVWSYSDQPFDLPAFGLAIQDAVIGYIEIPDMKIRLPLMLGASQANLEKGAAILSQTSMPIGGENTNCVIAGHRGWEGSAYFQYIENLKIGSKVYITNPWQTLVYECTGTKVIDPKDASSILIQKGKDMVTLFTCHPYVLGGGPYRYLAFCERVDTKKREAAGKMKNPKTEPAPETAASEAQLTTESGQEESVSHTPTPTQVPIMQNQETGLLADLDLLALEQTLRLVLPIVLLAVTAVIIITRQKNKSQHKRRKNNRKKGKKNTIKRAKP